VYPSGRCVTYYGCGDFPSSASPASVVYCRGIAKYGYDYQRNYGRGICPKTFSIVGVMSWQDPQWSKDRGNQNGTFPFNRNSTAFAVDYLGATLRGCYEGWEHWLRDSGTNTYAKGHLWGCVGTWYAGAWHTGAANGYIDRVRRTERRRPWLSSGWRRIKPHCSPRYGCPGPDRL
jgi:hypothetical protein